MKKKQFAIIALVSALAGAAHAQVVNDGATNTLNGGTTTIVGDVTVGTNGSFTLLILTNTALLTNSGQGYLGRNAGADLNTVWLTGTNTRWLMGGESLVGNSGTGNRLVISNGARVGNSLGGFLGYNTSSRDNLALVTGAGALWTNGAALHVGYSGARNQLVVSNGGEVRSGSGILGEFSTSSTNVAVVTGAGSRWTNAGDLSVGFNGAGNHLVVSNGGVVLSSIGELGVSGSSTNNAVLVTGVGSRWSMDDGSNIVNGSLLNVGSLGAGNQLVVSDGGVVENGLGSLGFNFSSSNNLAIVTGAGSLWTNWGSLLVGYAGGGNQLVVSNGGRVVNVRGILGFDSTSSNNVAVVTGAGSLWRGSYCYVGGDSGAGNRLVVTNGGVVDSAVAVVGSFSIGNNTAVVTGAGSQWRNSIFLKVGQFGEGFNQLVVSDGGVVLGADGYVGYGSSNNLALVTGAGSRWTNAGGLTVGFVTFNGNRAGNQLVVSNGGVVQSSFGGVGRYSDWNSAVVTGAGSLWTNEMNFVVGQDGDGNQLVVSNGGVVATFTGYLGFISTASNSSSNVALVTGAGSLWTNSASLYVGYGGAFNQLVVSAGGMVRAGAAVTLGEVSSSTNNRVEAVGGSLASVGLTLGNAGSRNNSVTLLSGSSWDVGGGPFIWGNAGFNNTLTIDATSALTNIGGLRLDENQTVFHLTNAPGGYTLNGFNTNQLQFQPTGLNAVVVGENGTNVQLTISNSTLASMTGTIGNNGSARSNLVLVAGAGSVWSNSSSLNIGNNGSFNQLVVSNGGALRAGGLVTLGNTSGSTNNSVLAVGGSLISVGLTLGNVASRNNRVTLLSNSIWDLGGGTFTWGNAGSGDTLTIDATSGLTNVGALTLDENDTANLLLNGTSLNGLNVGFKTSGLGALIVGNAGTNIQFALSNFIWAGTSGDIGLGATSRSNSVFLSGSGSAWSNTGDLSVGNGGAFNSLVIAAGAVVADTSGTVGNNAGAISNSVLVTGAGSRWTNSGALTIGNLGAFNQLAISNTATVAASNGVVVGFNSGAVSNSLLLSTGALLTNRGDGVLGFAAGADFNSVSVSDTNSRWLMSGLLYLGSNGVFNHLAIRNGGRVANGEASVGFTAASHGNEVLVGGPGSFWDNQGELFVGNSGSGNRLVITNGALVGNGFGYLGYNLASSNNEALVTGPNSYWNNRGNFFVGNSGSGNRLLITNGGRVANGLGSIGAFSTSRSNEVLVSGVGSLWENGSEVRVGNSGSGNRLVISDGGLVADDYGTLGANNIGNTNEAVVTGAGSYWNNRFDFYVGNGGVGNRLVITNGGRVENSSGYVGAFDSAQNNEVLVTGSGSFWSNRTALYVGDRGSGNRLLLANGGTVFAGSAVYVGFNSISSNNLLMVDGGTLRATNAGSTGVLDIRRGTNVLNAGLIEADRLGLTNASAQGGGFFTFNGGTLKTKGTITSNGQLFTVGNGTSPAAFELTGNGLHTFSNGLAIANNASLRGNGTLSGALTVAVGGSLSPGTSIGKIVLNSPPALLGNVTMEISRNGAILTNDQIQVAGPLTYGGSLTVSNLGPTTLVAGNRFQLFSAPGYAGTFSSITLPPGLGLAWTNKLAVDGSIEVITLVPPPVALTLQRSNNVLTVSWPTNAADYCLETTFNLAPPVAWQTVTGGITTNGASFVFTLPTNPATAKQFFRLAFPCSASPAPASLNFELSNNVLTVSWPSNAFRLETSFNLAPPASWQTISNGINNNGPLRSFSFTNSPAVTNQFFRLAFP